MALKLRFTAVWNTETVAEGNSTGVFAYDTMRQFMEGNFCGANHRAYMEGFSYSEFERYLATEGAFTAIFQEGGSVAMFTVSDKAWSVAKPAACDVDLILPEYAPQNGLYEGKGYNVTLDDATQYATVYQGDKPVATLRRARRDETGFVWKLYDLTGKTIRVFRYVPSSYARLATMTFARMSHSAYLKGL